MDFKKVIIINMFILISCASAFGMQDSISTDTLITIAQPKLTKSPLGAVARSLILPGWGQYYTEKYWKAPIFIGASGTLAYFIYDSNKKYNDIKKLTDAIDNKQSQEYLVLKSRREVHRNNRDQLAFYLFGVYAISAVDAYTSAHLFDFNVSDDVSLSLAPTIGSFSVTIKF